MNEGAIGNVLEKWLSSGKLKREELFIVTKLPGTGNRPEEVEKCIKQSLEALKLDYVDLYLIHLPVGLIAKEESGQFDLDMTTDHIALWKAMESQVEAGRAKSIGLSNFNIKQIDRILKNSKIPPANIQVEMHVYFQQKELMEFCSKNGITVCAYGPLGSSGLIDFTKSMGCSTEGIYAPLSDPEVKAISEVHKKTPAQILLRFLIQLGSAVIPKSSNPERIKQNIDIFDFELSSEEMEKLKKLDKGKEGRMFQKGFFKNLEGHPEYPF
ncbi:hypothetical protein AAG570_011014 [Ranatra chinensis]|uniref:NADP-dependent oxidoreductase domain-containing protein n=1 Tax=Ranatra chinensis TaxID=642074 RepID=A0ABD0YVL9_9HEMI